MNYEFLTIEDAQKIADNNLTEQKAVEYLDDLKERTFMTMNEVALENLIIKYKKQIEQLQDDVDQAYSTASNYANRFLKAIEYCGNTTRLNAKKVIEILEGEDNE